MHKQIHDNVFFGNWKSPTETIGKIGTIINVAHHFSVSKARNIYWSNLESIPWEVFQVRLAKKDGDTVDFAYINALIETIKQARNMDKLPILCHCQLGRHRGPTSAICAAWVLSGQTLSSLNQLVAKANELTDGNYSAPSSKRQYRDSMLSWMKLLSLK